MYQLLTFSAIFSLSWVTLNDTLAMISQYGHCNCDTELKIVPEYLASGNTGIGLPIIFAEVICKIVVCVA